MTRDQDRARGGGRDSSHRACADRELDPAALGDYIDRLYRAARSPCGSRHDRERGLVVPRLFMVTVPGLVVSSDWRVVHDRLLDEFAEVDDVLPTTTPETLLIVYRGRARLDEWLSAMSEGVLLVRMRLAARERRRAGARRFAG